MATQEEQRLQQARSQISQARQQLEKQRAEAKRVEEQLEKSRQALPERESQKALRQELTGLKGREARRKIKGAETEISKRQQVVQQTKKQLTRFETEKIKPAERSIQEYTAEKRAIEMAKKLYEKGVPLTQVSGRERKYYKQLMAGGKVSTSEIKGDAINLSGGIYSKSGELIGVADPFLQQSRLPTGFEKITGKITTSPLEKLKQQIKTSDLTTIKVDIPKVDLPKEYYDPRTNTYVSESPTGRQATAYVRPPTQTEQRRIDLAAKRGSVENVMDIAERIVTPVLEFAPVKFTTKTIRDIPVSSGVIGKVIGIKDTTLGETILTTKEQAEKYTSMSKKGWFDISEKLSKVGEEKPKIIKNIFESGSYLAKGIGFGVKTAPAVIQYSALGLIGGSAVDILEVEEKKKQVDKYIKIELEKQYKTYEEDYNKQLKDLKEGYKLEPKLTKETFNKKYSKEIEEQVMTGIKRESVIPTLLFIGGVGSKLGTKGIKYLREPITKRVTIKSPVTNLEVPEIVGKDVKYLTPSGTKNIVTYPKQQLGQAGAEGSRTIQTTRWNELFGGKIKVTNKGWEFIKAEPLYSGVPYGEVGSKTYKEALNRLIKSGYTESQAKNILRYSQPKVISQFGEGKINVKGDDTLGSFTFETRKPVININKDLGIKTRGGKPTKDIITFQRKILTTEEKQIILEANVKASELTRVSKDFKAGYNVDTNVGLLTGKESNIIKGYEPFISPNIKILKAGEYQKLTGTSFEKQIIPEAPIKYTLNLDSEALLFKKTIDLTGKGIEVTKENIVKTPFTKTFGEQVQVTENLLKSPPTTPKIIIKPTTTTSIIQPEISSIEQYPSMVGGVGLKEIPYAETGMYEVTEQTGINTMGIPNLNIMPKETIVQKELPAQVMQTLKSSQSLKEVQVLKPIQTLKPTQKLKQPSALKDAQSLRSMQTLKSYQALKEIQVLKQTQKTKQEPRPTPKTQATKIPLLPKLEKAITKAKKITKEEPNIFEAVGMRFGKEVSLLKGTKEKVSKKLSKFLTGTLGASGYLTKGGEKIKAEETGLLGKIGFRKSKVSPFLIVEEKKERLRRGTTGKEIQPFRKIKKGKTKSKKNLFGL